MKILARTIGLLLASLLPVSAQVTAEVTLEQEQFLPGEALAAAVRITNRSGQTLHFGTEPDWLTFSVESREGFIVVKTAEVPVLGAFTLESSKVATRRVDLAPYFALTRVASYNIVATMRVKEWNTEIRTPAKSFDIIHGAELWSQEFGVPAAGGTINQPPEVRKYILQKATYLRSRLRLYLKLTDATESRVIKVLPLGLMVSFSRPEPQLDKFSNLHLLCQNGAHTFGYAMINPDGELVVRQTYEQVNARPRLHADEAGKFTVAGGVRRISANDVPAPKILEDDVKTPKP